MIYDKRSLHLSKKKAAAVGERGDACRTGGPGAKRDKFAGPSGCVNHTFVLEYASPLRLTYHKRDMGQVDATASQAEARSCKPSGLAWPAPSPSRWSCLFSSSPVVACGGLFFFFHFRRAPQYYSYFFIFYF